MHTNTTTSLAYDATAPLHFIVNDASGNQELDGLADSIACALRAAGRHGEVHVCPPAQLARMSAERAQQARATRSAIVAVGGDGTLNTVAQAAHAAGCAMGVVPRGTFNYFARTHGIASELPQALAQLLAAQPAPVQIAAVNQQVFLVNASVGLYPDLLEDREAWKARFGRSRPVALWAAAATLLRAQRRLRLEIALDGQVRRVRTLTLFVGNNRLQLEQLGAQVNPLTGAENGHITAVMLKPIGILGMLRLMARGAMGSLGDDDSVERFEFQDMAIKPARLLRKRTMKVAFDGEVTRMAPPLNFRVLPQPLFLLKPAAGNTAAAA
ncbi:diacylglycerol/lipid kinase family protein [Hydrogenophaga sp. BPS33]|uniref:diacylglycerol/lipid kinase family protein n=1 Tax=Hydrogenophaga sp. BPS33 TaxID=2651974 RepID=UPI0013202375|nr:diacylglycerol kinase family protein [Hydrogenophaga sp. BPS33]QHE87564.1 diacylglycerol kinase [Hydrogenophaga sp. BPS33]